MTAHMHCRWDPWTFGSKSLKQIAATSFHSGSAQGTTVSIDGASDRLRVCQLEQELEVARNELRQAVADLKIANEDHKAIVEEAMRFLAAASRVVYQPMIAPAKIATRAEADCQASISVATLTVRQRQILELVLDGHPSKNIAADLGISQRTVDNHRAAIMRKTGSKSLPALVRMAMAAA